MVEDLIITGNSSIGSILTASYTRTGTASEGETLYQWYLNGEAIEGAIQKTYQGLEAGTYVVAVLPIDINGNEGEIVYSDDFEVSEEIEKPIEKEYIVKFYDKYMNFIKVATVGTVINDIQFTEAINEGQGQLMLNLNLPIDTDYLENVKFVKVFVSDNRSLSDSLLYTGYLSQYSRMFSNDEENVQAIFLSLFSLLSEVYFTDSNGNDEFVLEGVEPANVIKQVIDCFNEAYSGLITYTEYSVIDYGHNINIEVKGNKCSEVLKKILDGLNYYLFIGADGIVQFKPKPSNITHYFTYQKDVSELTIPESYEQIINAVRVQYGYLGGPHSGITERAEDSESIKKFGRKEQTVVNQNIYGNDAGVIYRDSILAKYSSGKQNITMSINNLYEIEKIHPGDTIKIRNLGIDIDGLQITSVSYKYEEVSIGLEYQSNLAQEIYNNNSI